MVFELISWISGISVGTIPLHVLLDALLVFSIGYVIAKILAGIAGTFLKKKMNLHMSLLLQKVIFYVLLFIVLMSTFSVLDINVTGIIAAAGVLGLVLGLAGQKSLSNIISGIILIFDKPFEVGDTIKIGELMGVVTDITLLSTRIRTFDNLSVRLPNDEVFSSKITNYSKYDIRRIKIPIGLAYKEKIQPAIDAILKVAEQHQNTLNEPKPQVIVKELADSSVNIELRAWVPRDEYFSTKSELITQSKNALDDAKIEIAYPHMSVYVEKLPGSEEKPKKKE
ncbi:mechanosensitive ion channel family protein [Candidatus Undinarchaeota archaeon]